MLKQQHDEDEEDLEESGYMHGNAIGMADSMQEQASATTDGSAESGA